jgi:hypothetical protein
MENMLKQLVRDRKGNPRGYVVAVRSDKWHSDSPEMTVCVKIGWSYTNVNAGDHFNKDKGFQIALNRASVGYTNATIPQNVMNTVNTMIMRSQKYFKTDDISVVGSRYELVD